jgi:predicted phosphoadenosine phosphosulfate sulfurtransferase
MGYPDDIPDEVPNELMRLGLAPSYRAIAVAILQNDLNFYSLGFASPTSPWYSALKRIEIAARPIPAHEHVSVQLRLFE